MKTCFMITSAINSKFSIFSEQNRFEHTLKTIDSIRKKQPDAFIFLLERTKLQKSHFKILSTLVDDFVFVDQRDEEITDYKKSINESELMGLALADKRTKEYDFVFKISGRYHLNDNFDPFYIKSENKNKIIAKRSIEAYMAPHKSFDTRLYCIGQEMIDYACESIKNVYINFFENIEHTIFRDIDENKLINLKILGVEGYVASTGFFYKG